MSYRHTKDNYLFSLFKDLETVGEYSMPKIKPVTDAKILNLITFNYAKTCKSPGCYHVCFFVDDYQFERIWNEPQINLELLKKFKGLIAPDFSLYRDFPVILNIYNSWRNKLLTAYYQKQGLEVIPTVSWTDEDSYRWCFDGLPMYSILAISSNGCLKDKTARELFVKGYHAMVERLKPIKVLLIGGIPPDLEGDELIENIPGYTSLFGTENKNLVYGGLKNGR